MIEVKNWSYEDYPEYTTPPEGTVTLDVPETTGVLYLNDVEYAAPGGTKLHLQILIPATRKSMEAAMSGAHSAQGLPCIVMVQGSAWMKQNVYLNLPQYAKVAQYGYVVAVAEYRHSGIAPFPAQVIDAGNAVRFMKVHADEYGIDPGKVFLAGDSSGGHTAVWAGIRNNDHTDENLFPGVSAGVRGIVDYYGATSVMFEDGNPTTANHHMPDSPEGMELGRVNLKERPDLCRQFSAECNITDSTPIPPVLIFHGSKDKTVHPEQSAALYEALKAHGKRAEFYLIRGADHGSPEFWSDTCNRIVDRFLRSCLEE